MTIQRYHGVEQACVFKSDTGSLVYYIDHQRDKEAAIAEKDKENNRLMNQLAVLVADNARFREALEFYANDNNYHRTLHVGGDYDYSPRLIISIDNGEKARQALKEVKGD